MYIQWDGLTKASLRKRFGVKDSLTGSISRLIIAKKRYGLVPSLHSISNSIGQVLFRRADIRELYNQPMLPVNVLETEAVEQLTLW